MLALLVPHTTHYRRNILGLNKKGCSCLSPPPPGPWQSPAPGPLVCTQDYPGKGQMFEKLKMPQNSHYFPSEPV